MYCTHCGQDEKKILELKKLLKWAFEQLPSPTIEDDYDSINDNYSCTFCGGESRFEFNLIHHPNCYWNKIKNILKEE